MELTRSIVIPVHNEAGNIVPAVTKLIVSDFECDEILLLANGCTDGSVEEIRQLAESFPVVRCIELSRGSYGEAIRVGLENACGDHLFILEIDFIDLSFLSGSSKLLSKGIAMVVGSKRHKASIDQRPLVRRLLTTIFNLMLKIFFEFKGTDTHGLKAFTREAFERLSIYTITSDEAYQTELVLLGERLRIPKAEVPVTLRELRRSPTGILSRIPKVIRLFIDLRHSLSRRELV